MTFAIETQAQAQNSSRNKDYWKHISRNSEVMSAGRIHTSVPTYIILKVCVCLCLYAYKNIKSAKCATLPPSSPTVVT